MLSEKTQTLIDIMAETRDVLTAHMEELSEKRSVEMEKVNALNKEINKVAYQITEATTLIERLRKCLNETGGDLVASDILVVGGMEWEEFAISHSGKKKWVAKGHDFEVFLTKTGKYRLISFEHSPSAQFPDAEFWMQEYKTLEEAAEYAEKM